MHRTIRWSEGSRRLLAMSRSCFIAADFDERLKSGKKAMSRACLESSKDD